MVRLKQRDLAQRFKDAVKSVTFSNVPRDDEEDSDEEEDNSDIEECESFEDYQQYRSGSGEECDPPEQLSAEWLKQWEGIAGPPPQFGQPPPSSALQSPESQETSTPVLTSFSSSVAPTEAPPGIHPPGNPSGPHGGRKTATVVVAVLVPLIFMLILALFALWWFRRKSRRNRAQAPSRSTNMNEELNYSKMAYPQQEPPGPIPSGSLPSLHSQQPITNVPPIPAPVPATIPHQRPPSTQPIILGPMNPSAAGNYYTGLEADAVSLSDGPQHANAQCAMIEDPDEPPPPYRPRSVVSFVSREPSTRQGSIHPISETDESTHNLIRREPSRRIRSPFADPDDDAVSLMSEARS